MKTKRFLHVLPVLIIVLLVCASIAPTAVAAPDSKVRVWVVFQSTGKASVEHALRASGAEFHYTFDNLNAFVVSLPEAALDGIRHNRNVKLVEEDALRYPMGQMTPYGIAMVQAPEMWASGSTGSGITVCVIDSGVKTTHEDLSGAIFLGGYPSTWNQDTCGHGSHVSGTILARNNTLGVVGVAPNVKEYMVKVFDGSNCGWSYSSTLVDAANRCYAAGAKIISMSLGGSLYSSAENSAFASLYSKGVLPIAAAGNAGNTKVSYPAGYTSVVSVAAVDSNGTVASFSQHNSDVEIAAPGVAVMSTVPFSTLYEEWSGTSMATPHVSAVAALLWSAVPEASNQQIRDAMNFSAKDLGTAGRDTYYGYGLVQAMAAYEYLKSAPPPPPPPPPPSGSLTVSVSTDKATYTDRQSVKITVTVTDGGAPVSGAAVTTVVITAKGTLTTLTGTTGTTGQVTHSYKISVRKGGTGTYSVTSTASKTGYTNGSGVTTFTVQ